MELSTTPASTNCTVGPDTAVTASSSVALQLSTSITLIGYFIPGVNMSPVKSALICVALTYTTPVVVLCPPSDAVTPFFMESARKPVPVILSGPPPAHTVVMLVIGFTARLIFGTGAAVNGDGML